MSKPVSILLLEDSVLDAELIRAQVERAGVQADIKHVDTRQGFENAISGEHDLILSDYALPDFDGLSALDLARKQAPSTPFIFVSGTLGEDVAIHSLHHGATDYVLKHRLERLAPAIRRALDEKAERELRQQSQDQLKASESRFRELAEALPQLVWTMDRTGAITYCNRHAREYAGFAWLNQSPPGIEIAHPADRAHVLDCWQQSLRNHTPLELDYRLLHAEDKNYRWHLVRFVPMRSESGELEEWVVTAVDVEDQKRREQALRVSEEALLLANETLEQRVQERTEAYQKLSGKLLHIQDVERRRIARELHDSLGQYLSGLKINLDIMRASFNGDGNESRTQLLSQSVQILERCISEVRTTSYLLHPPMLDEAGFALAAEWYVQGFGKRSGIATRLELPENLERLPQAIEVALFRVLQEVLTNVHRHSNSPEVDVRVRIKDRRIYLDVRDYGKGISEERLTAFRNGASDLGVGLAGMRERVRELNGSLEVTCNGGTRVAVMIPLHFKTGTVTEFPSRQEEAVTPLSGWRRMQ